MRNRLLAAAAFLAALGSGQASAETYASVTGGAALLTDSDIEGAGVTAEAAFDVGFSVSGALGYVWKRLTLGDIRAELEVGYRSNDIDEISALGMTASGGDADVSALSGMLNLALDFETNAPWQPYIMAGVGAASVMLENDSLDVDEEDTVFAYQAGAGLNLAVTESLTLFGGYRFFGTANPEFEGVEVEYQSHLAEAGMRVSF